ncbi:MAG: RraA family protein [Pseudomonadota bacterium]
MSVTVYTPSVANIEDEDVEAWRAVPVAVAVDILPESQIDTGIRPLNPPGQQPRLCGRAVTAKCIAPDFGAVLQAIDRVETGDVLVIAASGYAENAMIGEILGGHLRRRGCAGIVCDGAVRDVAQLSEWSDFAVFTRHVNPKGPEGADQGAVFSQVYVGDRKIDPGDLILGDDDGLAVLTSQMVKDCRAEAVQRIALEKQWEQSLSAGESVQAVFDLSPPKSG